MSARSVLAFSLCSLSMAVAVNLVYDEVLWTKKIWSSAKVGNMLLYTNPTDQDPQLLQVYPSVRGSIANSLDGPNEKRDASTRPADTDGLFEAGGLEGLSGLPLISEASDIKPAAQAAQCSVCHVLMVQAWQNLTSQAVDGLLKLPPAAGPFVPSRQVVKDQLLETCKKETGEAMLAKQAILRLEDPKAGFVFFVVRERGRRKSSKPSAAERRAVRLACKNLMLEAGDDMARILQDMLDIFRSQLESVLKQEGLLGDAAVPAADGSAAGDDVGSGGAGGLAADEPERHAAQLAGLVKHALRRAWPEPGALPSPTPAAAEAKAKAAADDYDDDDEVEEEDVDPDCMDMHPMCVAWADKGECEENPKYMVGGPNHIGHCKRACGVCTPKSKGARDGDGLVDSTALRAAHPALVDKLEQLLKPLQAGLCSSACSAAKACLSGVLGISSGQGFAPSDGISLTPAAPWQLEKPHFGAASVEPLVAGEVAGHASAEPGSLAAEVEAALGPELRQKVVSVAGDFFIYEYLYKNHTRHYHVDEQTGTYTEDYMLGSFKRESVDPVSASTGTYSTLEERDLLPNMFALLSRKDWPYVKQVYAGGDECHLGGGRRAVRKTEARIACSPDQKLYMLVREPDFCQYVFVIYSPALCKVERFKPQPKPQPKLLDDDDEYE